MLNSGTGTVTWLSGTDWRGTATSAIQAHTDYLILMGDSLSEALVDSIAVHRAQFNGFNVSIAKMAQIDSTLNITTTPDTIRAFIKTIYDAKSAAHPSDSLLSYVLLVGDASTNDSTEVVIPSYYGFGSSPDGFDKCADIYYSLLSSDDPATAR
jgi:hypothetical protein